MSRARRRTGWPVALLAVPVLAGCAGLAAVRAERARTGEIVVRTGRHVPFDRVAAEAYGDPGLGRSIALLAHLPYEAGLPGGAVLVLPVRDQLEERLGREEASERAFERGLAAADAGAFRAAAEHFRAALREAPNRMDVRYNLGLALLRAGELVEATSILETVARARPEDPESRYAFGSVLRRRRAYHRAYREFEAALRLDPRHARAAFARARTLEDLGRPERAARAWRRFLAEFPEDPLAAAARRALEDLERPPQEALPGETGGGGPEGTAP